MSVRILIGDVREKLAELPADHFDCVVTSPPYWGLRDYGTATWEGGQSGCDHRSPTMRAGREEARTKLAGSDATNSAQLLLAHRSACGKCGALKVDRQIGLEPTLGEHLAVMVDVMRAVRRVLKPTGTLWLNYGDCYATSPNGRSAADTKATGNDDRTFRDKPFSTVGPIYDPDGGAKGGGYRGANKGQEHSPSGRVVAGGLLKPKDLCMVPNRLAIALQDDGWWVRSEIIWAKPNPMPESINDRPATAHEKIWLLSKSARYHYDAEAVRQTAIGATEHDLTGGRYSPPGQVPHTGSRRAKQSATAGAAALAGGSSGRRMEGFNARWEAKEAAQRPQRVRAEEIARERGLTPAHFEAIRACGIADAGKALVTTTGAGHNTAEMLRLAAEAKEVLGGYYREFLFQGGRNLRNYEPAPVAVWPIATRSFPEAHFATFPPELAERCIQAGCPAGGRILDPFGGAGTVGLVADRFGLDCTLIELNPAYADMAGARIRRDAGMFAEVASFPDRTALAQSTKLDETRVMTSKSGLESPPHG